MRISILLVLVLVAYVSARYEDRGYEQKGPGGVKSWSRDEYEGKRGGYRKKDYDGGKYGYKKDEYKKRYQEDDSDEDSDEEADSNEREEYQEKHFKKEWKEGKKHKKYDSTEKSYKGGKYDDDDRSTEKKYKKGKYEDDSSEKQYRNEKYENKKYKQSKYIDDDSREKSYKTDKYDGDYEGKKYYKEKKYKGDKYYDRDSYKDKRRNYKPRKYDDDSFEYSDRDSKEYDPRYSNEFDDAGVYFSKRKLQYFEEEDGFFDDVKAYHQRENHVPNYEEVEYRKPQYEERYREDRRRDHSDERYHKERRHHDDRHYYKERYYEIESPEVERQKYRQIQDEKDYRKEKYQPQENYQPKEKRIEGGGERKYSWKQDREKWAKLPPLVIPPPERPLRDFVPTAERPDPPPVTEAAKMARYIVHNSDWTTVATISTLRHIRNYPFVNVLSVSDGPVEAGSGIPYLYMTELDMTPHDLAADRRCSLSMSLAETDYCKQQKLDPEDPRCAHLTLTGEMWKLKNGTEAAKRAEDALFSRHPSMKNWPKDHNFFFATLKIEQIVLLDYFGGPKFVDVKDYLRANLTT